MDANKTFPITCIKHQSLPPEIVKESGPGGLLELGPLLYTITAERKSRKHWSLSLSFFDAPFFYCIFPIRGLNSVCILYVYVAVRLNS